MRVARVLAIVVLAGVGVTACVNPPAPPPGGGILTHLNGSFTGTTFYTNQPGCPIAHEVFTGEYDVPNAVKEVEIDLFGCVDGTITTYTGTFKIDTDAGTLRGSVVGTLRFNGSGFDHELTLTVESATGRFRSAIGDSMRVSIQCNCGSGPPSTPIPFAATLTALYP
jgi:hypothetical protein